MIVLSLPTPTVAIIYQRVKEQSNEVSSISESGVAFFDTLRSLGFTHIEDEPLI